MCRIANGCVSANPRIRFMISVVSAGVQIVRTLNNNLNLFSSPFGSFSLYLKYCFFRRTKESCFAIFVGQPRPGWALLGGGWFGAGGEVWTKGPLEVGGCFLDAPGSEDRVLPKPLLCSCWYFTVVGYSLWLRLERSVFQKRRTPRSVFPCMLFSCSDVRAQTVAGEERKSGIFPNGVWPRGWCSCLPSAWKGA